MGLLLFPRLRIGEPRVRSHLPPLIHEPTPWNILYLPTAGPGGAAGPIWKSGGALPCQPGRGMAVLRAQLLFSLSWRLLGLPYPGSTHSRFRRKTYIEFPPMLRAVLMATRVAALPVALLISLPRRWPPPRRRHRHRHRLRPRCPVHPAEI
jgi:hypothetical protein